MTPLIAPSAYRLDADHRGAWTQIFGDTVTTTERKGFGLVEKRNFYQPHQHLAPSLVVIPSEFRQDLWRQKTGVPRLSRGVAGTTTC